MAREYEIVIGLEVHVELSTRTKIFCGCSTAFGGRPNSHTCPVCTGMPGSLPVLNRQVLDYAVAVGLATHCQIARYGRFDRKNYFYPDNPQNYQISQLYLPICRDGYVEIDTEEGSRRVGIHEIHMEEDAGKLIHEEGQDCTLVDYNRSGVPLIEIVTEPDMHSAEEVIACLEQLRLTIQYLGASDCKLQEGSMRADVNLSMREKGTKALGTRTEMKNLSSFHAIIKAVEGESRRQTALLKAGEEVVMETRRWDEDKGVSYAMRSKEDARDYRYFPDPDLTPVRISDEYLERIRAGQPELPREKRARYRREYDIPDYDIEIITGSRHMAELFEAAAAICGQPKKVSNWLMGETLRLLKEREMDAQDIRVSPAHLAALVEMVEGKEITGTVAKEVYEVMFAEDVDPKQYVEKKGLKTVCDEEALRRVIQEVIASNPQSVEDYRRGKDRALGFLVGQTMKAMKGKADPAGVNRILKELL